MDPLLVQLAISLAAEGLAALLSRSATELSDDLLGFEHAVREAIAQVEDVPEIDPALGGESLRQFLRSQEVLALVKRVYAGQMSDADAPLDALRAEFVDLWRFQMGAPDATGEQAGRLFDVILAACDGTLEAATQAGSLGALDARASRRQRLLLDKLDLVHASIEAMRSNEVSAADVDAFCERYRQLVRQREGTIVPPNFDAAPKVPIADLYVESPLQSIEDPAHRARDKLRYPDLIADLGCKVVLGNPGSGKSTLSKKLVTDYASLESDGARPLVPFRVVLRDYGAQKKSSPCSIREYIETRVSADYQLQPPAGAIEYLLASGAAVVVFDGLDELLETSYRREISADIESFTTLYPLVPLLVTSREVGYSQAPLDDSLFDAYRLAPFSERQVRQYVTKWFAREVGLSRAEREQQVRSFMRESKSVADLRSNPLMLALMCTIYRGEGYIPENRPDVYERCAVLLFDRWDRQRQIKVPLRIESHVKPAMQYLAHWIYTDAGVEAEVPEREIVAKAAEYLLEKRYEDPDEAEQEARRFVEFCTGRAWVFTDVGTTASGERLYDFTHTTFLEYFAAGHLVRTNSNPATLNSVLIPHIERKEWDVVAQLAYQMLDRNVDGAGESLLEELVPAQVEPDSSEQLNRLGFAVRALEFLVPPPATTRRIATTAAQTALRWIDVRGLIDRTAEEEPTGGDNFVDIVMALAAASPENLDVIEASCEALLVDAIRDGGDRAVAAAELALRLGARLPEEFDRAVIASVGLELKSLASSERPIAVELTARGILEIDRCVSILGGISSVFESFGYQIRPRHSRPSLAEIMVSAATLSASEHHRRGWKLRTTPVAARAFLKALAPLLLEHSPPWYGIGNAIRLGVMSHFEPTAEDAGVAASDLDADQWFSVAAILAALWEEEDFSTLHPLHGEPPPPLRRELDPIAVLIEAKADSTREEKAREVEDERGFSAEQQALLRAWRAREAHFFAVPERLAR